MIFASASLVISASLFSTKKRTLFSRLPLSEPTINWDSDKTRAWAPEQDRTRVRVQIEHSVGTISPPAQIYLRSPLQTQTCPAFPPSQPAYPLWSKYLSSVMHCRQPTIKLPTCSPRLFTSHGTFPKQDGSAASRKICWMSPSGLGLMPWSSTMRAHCVKSQSWSSRVVSIWRRRNVLT